MCKFHRAIIQLCAISRNNKWIENKNCITTDYVTLPDSWASFVHSSNPTIQWIDLPYTFDVFTCKLSTSRLLFMCIFCVNSQRFNKRGENSPCSYNLMQIKASMKVVCGISVRFPYLKTLDTIGNCQRQVFSLSVSHHMHKTTNLWKFELNWSSKLRDNNERKEHPCHTKLCAFRCLISRPQILNLRSRTEGAVSYNVLYYQPLHITHNQVRCHAHNYLSNYQ